MNQGFNGWSVVPPATVPYINIQDQKAQNTAGGTFTSGAWQTRTLNTVVNDTANIASLASNQLTLPAGAYRCYISSPGYQVVRHQSRLRNITDAVTLLTGTSELANNGATVQSRSIIAGRFTLTSTKTIEVQHQCQQTLTSQGFGTEANFGTEVYAVAEFWKES